MTLLTPGYWQSTYWVEDFWQGDYWGDYGAVIAEYLHLTLSQVQALSIALSQESTFNLMLTQEKA